MEGAFTKKIQIKNSKSFGTQNNTYFACIFVTSIWDTNADLKCKKYPFKKSVFNENHKFIYDIRQDETSI